MRTAGILFGVVLSASVWAPAFGWPHNTMAVWSPECGAGRHLSDTPDRDLLDARTRASIPSWRIDELLKQRQAEADTCAALWQEPFYYLWEFAQVRCEATQCEFTEETYINSVSIVWNNYAAEATEKDVQIFVTDDAGGLPGEVLWSIDTTTTLIEGDGTVCVDYIVDPPLGLFGPGSIWFGHMEPVSGPPSSLFDEAADGSHAAGGPPCGTWWIQDLGDYLQFLNGSESTSISEDIPVIEQHGTIRLERPLNPVLSELRLRLILAQSQPVSLSIISPAGQREIDVLSDTWLSAGEHDLAAGVERLPAGVYFLHLQAPEYRETTKLLVIH